MGLLYEELTYEIKGCIFKVHNSLKTGYDEESYHIALEKRLAKENIPFQSKVHFWLEHRGVKVHKFIADLIIADKVILELKNTQSEFVPANFQQILSYLKCWQKELGMLVNFGRPKTSFKRVIFTERAPNYVEDYSSIQGRYTTETRNYLKNIRAAILTVLEFHGLGYGESIYQALIKEELSYQQIPFTVENIIPLVYEEQFIRNFELKHPIIANQIICSVVAFKKNIEYDIKNLQNYLKALNIPIGILAHFGKEKLEILGVTP